MQGDVFVGDASNQPVEAQPPGVFYFDGTTVYMPAAFIQGSCGDLMPSRISLVVKNKFGAALSIQGVIGQVGPLQVIQDSAGSNLFEIDAAGYLHVLTTTAPPDGRLQAKDCIMWLDPTPGATKIMFKAKDTNGAVRTGSIPLT